MKFNLRKGDLEVRSCNQNLSQSNEHQTAEVIKWEKHMDGKEYCYVLAYWVKDKEGFYLHFVGNRPFQVPHSEFMAMAFLGQKDLDFFFNNQENE